MSAVTGITRTDVDSLIETQVANEIFEGTIRQSKALSMFKRLPNATSDKTKLRVLSFKHHKCLLLSYKLTDPSGFKLAKGKRALVSFSAFTGFGISQPKRITTRSATISSCAKL